MPYTQAVANSPENTAKLHSLRPLSERVETISRQIGGDSHSFHPIGIGREIDLSLLLVDM